MPTRGLTTIYLSGHDSTFKFTNLTMYIYILICALMYIKIIYIITRPPRGIVFFSSYPIPPRTPFGYNTAAVFTRRFIFLIESYSAPSSSPPPLKHVTRAYDYTPIGFRRCIYWSRAAVADPAIIRDFKYPSNA